MKLPNYDRVEIPKAKIVDYLLSLTHPGGRGKAVFFLARGFRAESWEDFAIALREHAAEHDVKKIEDSLFGKRYTIEGSLASPDGRDPMVRTVWFVDSGESTPRFVTAFPLKRR